MKPQRHHGQIVTCGGCNGTGQPISSEWREEGNPNCIKCGGSGKRKVCLNVGCQEFGCEGHGNCEVPK